MSNLQALLSQMIEERTIKIWTLAGDKAEFKRHHRLLDGSLVSVVDEAVIRQSLSESVVSSLTDSSFAIALHDPCDIRKPYSQSMEYIGQVRSLDGSIINGYGTFDTALCNGVGGGLRPFDITVYSNGDPRYVTQEELSHRDHAGWEGWVDHEDRAMLVDQLVSSGDYHNQVTIRHDQMQRVSHTLKAHHPEIQIRHILDREHDDKDLFSWIDQELNDEFVIRMKLSRNSSLTVKNPKTGRDRAIKLKDVDFEHGELFVIPKLAIKGRVYQDVRCILEWESFCIDDRSYTVVRISLVDRKDNLIFGEPMLLITNATVTNFDQALAIYRHYLLRAKIEGIFKFLKSMLGWEEFQIREFVPIKNLLAVGFFVAGYFYEIESELTKENTIQWLARLGGAKNGEVTRFFVSKGFSKIINYNSVEKFKIENPMPKNLLEITLGFVT